jgi:Mn-dependent DtxR family transcriptional regulator
MTGLLGGANYSMNQASYDLARLRVNGLITRIPGRNLYRLTGDGLRFAIFYTKVHDRLLRPLLAADQPPAPLSIRNALHTIDIHIIDRIDNARLLPAAA